MRLVPPHYSVPQELSLDLGESDSNQQLGHVAIDQAGTGRSVIFPKNIKIYDVSDFQRWVSQVVAPLSIRIDFRVIRHNRVEMRWSFPQEAEHYQSHGGASAELMRFLG